MYLRKLSILLTKKIKKMKKIIPAFLIGLFVCAIIVIQCSPSSEEKEEAAQIEEVEALSFCPTYYVDSITDTDGIYKVLLHRNSNRADGTLPEKLTVTFDEEYTPSVAYLRKNDSIKVNIYASSDQERINGRYVTTTSYEADLFIFVDQIPALRQKHAAANEE